MDIIFVENSDKRGFEITSALRQATETRISDKGDIQSLETLKIDFIVIDTNADEFRLTIME